MNAELLKDRRLPVWLLRIGLAGTLLYAGISSLVTPDDWLGYLPGLVTDIVDGEVFLNLFAVYQLALATWLLSGYYLHLAALACAATMGGIFLGNLSLIEITFRDAGLFFAALTLAALAWAEQKA